VLLVGKNDTLGCRKPESVTPRRTEVLHLPNKKYTKPPGRNHILAVLVTLAAIIVALTLRLQGAELGAVLVAALGVALALARK
jgi:hypothetical protein